jgi:hypothetical protein
MGCDFLTDDEGKVTVIMCSRGQRKRKCVSCGRFKATQLCDWKLSGKKAGKTCDRPLCPQCSVVPAPNKDLCPAHAKMWEEWKLAHADTIMDG